MSALKMFDRVIRTHQLLWKRSNGIGNLQESLKVGGNFVLRQFPIGKVHENVLQESLKVGGNFVPRQFPIGNEHDNELGPQQMMSSVDFMARDDDFLGAKKFGNKFLMGRSYNNNNNNNKQVEVPVESLRGKIVGLYFEQESASPPYVGSRVHVRVEEFYNYLKLTKPGSFEMVYVPLVPSDGCEEEEDPSIHNALLSMIPWLYVPVHALDWRYYLHRLYNQHYYTTDIVFIDTTTDKIKVLPRGNELDNIYRYGPDYYPFTAERVEQLKAQLIQLGRETSIQAILGSHSRDYLIDPYSNKVPISSLQNKHVLIFPYVTFTFPFAHALPEKLVEIYNVFHNTGLEIVSVNFDNHNTENEICENAWKDHLAQIPWLSLPSGDEKIWPLRSMLYYNVAYYSDGDPFLLVKPKGEYLLDPYGYQILDKFGIQAFPFTRKAAADYLMTTLKGLSFKSFVDEASRLGLDFNSLIRNKATGGTEHVSLSTLFEGKSRGILILFASLETCSRERLESLIDVYRSQNESSSPSFEVIFVSIDKDTRSFDEHFSIMPWLALQRPLKPSEREKLVESTTNIYFNGYGNFLAFGPDQLLMRVGMLTKSFENCEFPFINYAESAEHVLYPMAEALELKREADGTLSYAGDGWWRGLEGRHY